MNAFWGYIWNKLGYFLFQPLVTLAITQGENSFMKEAPGAHFFGDRKQGSWRHSDGSQNHFKSRRTKEWRERERERLSQSCQT